MNYDQFFDNSPAYKNMLTYIKSLPFYANAQPEHIEASTKAVLETVIIYKDDLYNEKFYASSTESLLCAQNSDETRSFVANQKPDLFHIKSAIFQFFINSEKGFEVILNDIALYMPQEKLSIDFNTNFKNFHAKSSVMSYIKEKVLEDDTISIYKSQTQLVNNIADIICEVAVLHIDKVQASEFKEKNIKDYISPNISQHLQRYFEQQDEMGVLLCQMGKLTALKALMQKDDNNNSYMIKLKEEINGFHEYMVLQEMLPVSTKKTKHNKI